MVDPVLPASADLGPAAEHPSPEASYGLEELLLTAGERLGEEITPRTVRLYATQGLIDRPGKEGRSAVYGQRHLLQLLLIRSLARRGLSLSAIAPLCVLPDAEIAQHLSQLENANGESSPSLPDVNLALAYLQDLEGESKRFAASRRPAQLSLPSESELDREVDDLSTSPSLLSMLGSPLSKRAGLFSARRSPSRSSGSRDAASRWHRFLLAPGVELHINESVSIPPSGSRRISWLQKLADRLLEQLDERQS
jgi:DNA-binding transcriptional MerR regulator